ncbi:MAG TPA: hypothetical protein ENJ98_06750 [Thiolapillus brandeum]|uniref:PIN domain-containing protein n=1 Tax=Thiolapillus brandeum TaxID=1076588 RepID=A0A7C5N0M5_9GAMM|nr:hypothetical protein [Thiolapillus brandeum]
MILYLDTSALLKAYVEENHSSEVTRACLYAEAFALRAYDSVHLAAAKLLAERAEEPVCFACYDRKLNQAAEVLGLKLLADGA